MTRARFVPLLAALAVTAPAAAEDTKPGVPKTVMVTPGKVIAEDSLTASLGKEWKTAKGKFDAKDGAIRGAELAADMHGAVTRRNVEMKDVVVEYSFKLDGGKQTSLSFNGEKGHICRVLVRPTGVTVQKDDQDGKTGSDTAAPLGTAEVAVTSGEWHTLVVELRGPDILATLDGKHTAFGTHPAIDKPKANLGLTVSGEAVWFKGLKVWAADGTTKDWETIRAKLLDAKKK